MTVPAFQPASRSKPWVDAMYRSSTAGSSGEMGVTTSPTVFWSVALYRAPSWKWSPNGMPTPTSPERITLVVPNSGTGGTNANDAYGTSLPPIAGKAPPIRSFGTAGVTLVSSVLLCARAKRFSQPSGGMMPMSTPTDPRPGSCGMGPWIAE